jgi:hypothetical protein
MKLRISKEQGGILIVTLVTVGIMGITLASYLQYTATQSKSITRSEEWNAGIPVAEAGIEEALAHINDSAIGTNFALNGWTVVSNKFQLAANMDGGRYVVNVSTDRFPIITCTGYTIKGGQTNEYARTVRVTTTQYATGMKGLITKGDVTMNGGTTIDSFDSGDPAYNTMGHYDASKSKDGGYVASVFGNVTAETVYGSAGTGPTGAATGTVGDFAWVASNTGVQPGKYANDVNLAFPTVQPPWTGGAASLPGGGTVALTNYYFWSTKITTNQPPATMPPSGVITNLSGGLMTIAYPSYPVGVPAGLITTNLWLNYQEKKTLPAPPVGSYVGPITTVGSWRYYNKVTGYTYPASITYTYSLSATNALMTTNDYKYILSGDNYEVSNLKLSGGTEKMLVTGTNVTLYIHQDFTMTGGSEVVIAPGASLKIITDGDVSLAGNGIFNYNLDASHFSLYGTPSCQNIAISGNANFTGVIYAPDADIAMNGSGSTNYDVVGALIGKTANLNGHFHFHYDEALSRARIQSKYNVASWREI